MQDGKVVWLPDQVRFVIEVKIHALLRFTVIDALRHQEIGRVMIALRFHKARVKFREYGLGRLERRSQDLELLTTAAFDESAANQMIDHLLTRAVTDGPH